MMNSAEAMKGGRNGNKKKGEILFTITRVDPSSSDSE